MKKQYQHDKLKYLEEKCGLCQQVGFSQTSQYQVLEGKLKGWDLNSNLMQ